ncbi:hypothetical protein EYZ11_009708 [Aspergillus tanneri]|uniref:RRM domain-containing protein n=1 Tax=Aspergillus tanneri TaxID=1220188 RepID=A0A4S3J7M7_9EURO|nr:hypothetical protein EYZ11_009708 [Aspergillus tanneri]
MITKSDARLTLPQVLIYGSTLHDTQPKGGIGLHGYLEAAPSSKGHYPVHSIDHKPFINSDDDDDALLDSQDGDDNDKDDYEVSSRTTGSLSDTADRRTILIRNLADRVTHKDIVEAMRGGALLHVYLRGREHTANVSFVEEADAQRFFQHAKSYGLYVAGRRVEILWNDRQFYLPPFVRAKINNGASRNLVIYNVNPNITEWLIRKDLEHIHNLIVVSVKFKNRNAYISTNSVHNALFARSCMMSRLTYKGMKIAFYHDECSSPLPKAPSGPKKEAQGLLKKPPAPNRFQLLSLADEDGSDSEQNHDGLDSHHMNEGVPCADSRVSA